MEKSVIELFAGVGGFRVGLNHIKTMDENGKAIENGNLFGLISGNQKQRNKMPMNVIKKDLVMNVVTRIFLR